MVGTGAVALMYLALNMVFIFGTPLETMKGELAVGALAASRLFGPQVAGVFGAHGIGHCVDRERHDYDRPSCLLRDGQGRRISQRRCSVEPTITSADSSGHLSRRVRAAYDV
jgi:hypothetical protein